MMNKAKILVVEDRPGISSAIVRVLSRVGCEVVVAETGKRGTELARESRFDLIALETELLDFNAYELAYELKQRHISRRTPIVFVGGGLRENGGQCCRMAADYIAKPFDAAGFALESLSHV